ncbi:MAG: hypothetical protein ACOC36_06565 [Fibrobacterota bacterium]
MNLTIEEARAMMSGLGQRYHTGDQEDAFLYECDAEQLILEYALSNELKLPAADLAQFDHADSDDDWHQTLEEIIRRAARDPQYRDSLPKDFVSLIDTFVQSFRLDQ